MIFSFPWGTNEMFDLFFHRVKNTAMAQLKFSNLTIRQLIKNKKQTVAPAPIQGLTIGLFNKFIVLKCNNLNNIF